MVNLGLAFVNPAPLIKPENVVNFAKKCEAMGLHSLWTIDRVAYDNLDSMTLLAAAAGVTQRIRIGTSVLLAGLRPPALLAKTIATLDFISNGRLTIGVGFGSRENDFASVEIPYEGRGSRAVECVQLMKRLWTEDNVTHKGRFYNVQNLVMRYYGRLRGDMSATSLIGPPTAIAERIDSFIECGLDTLIIGLADPDPRQLDLFGEKVVPKLK
jgi:alkanesulfonate monooxygenase SsuD/methylene tetrahydromethanopterin reductase-like flavin-dependent oxidoreductase (luciferase family)